MMFHSLLGLLLALPGLYQGAPTDCFLSCRKPSRLKFSPNLCSYVPYEGSIPQLLHLQEQSLLQVYKTTTVLFVVLRAVYLKLSFKGSLFAKRSYTCSSNREIQGFVNVTPRICRIMCMSLFLSQEEFQF